MPTMAMTIREEKFSVHHVLQVIENPKYINLKLFIQNVMKTKDGFSEMEEMVENNAKNILNQ